MVVEAGQPVGLGLVLEACADVRVVERERGRVREPLRQLELVLVESGFLAQPVDVQRALEMVARDQRDGDQRLGIVLGRPRHELDARIEVRLIRQHGLAMLGRPAGDALSERDGVREDLVRPLVAGQDRPEDALQLVRRVDRQCVVRDEIGERVGDPLEQPVEALLGEHVVKDVGQAPVRLGERLLTGRIGRRFLLGLGGGQKAHRRAPLPLTGRCGFAVELRPQSRLLLGQGLTQLRGVSTDSNPPEWGLTPNVREVADWCEPNRGSRLAGAAESAPRPKWRSRSAAR